MKCHILHGGTGSEARVIRQRALSRMTAGKQQRRNSSGEQGRAHNARILHSANDFIPAFLKPAVFALTKAR